MIKKPTNLKEALPFLLVIGGSIGLLSAIVLVVEKVQLLNNPGQALNCDINPIIACGSIINTPQASIFGFPNPLIGVASFAVLITIGMGIFAGAKYKTWFWRGLQLGVIFGICFVHWLMFQAIFTIGALCPYCMVVWSTMIPLFIYITLYNFDQKHLVAPKNLKPVVAFIRKHHAEVLLTWYLVIFAVILNQFWFYWSTLI